MSDLRTDSSISDDHGLTTADIDRALHTSLQRGGRLVRRRNRRRAAVSGFGVAVLLLGGFGVLRSLGDDEGSVVVTPAGDSGRDQAGTSLLAPTIPTTTESSVPAPAAPPGFSGTRIDDGSIWLHNTTDQPEQSTTTLANGVGLGDPATLGREPMVADSTRLSASTLRVVFTCPGSTAGRIEDVVYRRVGAEVEVQAYVSTTGGGEPCAGGAGAEIDLLFPDGDLPEGAIAVDGTFEDPEG